MDWLKEILKKLGAKAEDIDAAVVAAERAMAEEVSGLKRKNTELLEAQRATKSGAERQLLEAQDRIAELETQVAKATADSKKAADKYATDIKAAQDAALAKSAKLGQLIRDEGVQREALAVGIKNPVHLKAVMAMLREQVQVDEEKGEAFVLAKDAKTGAETRKSLPDFMKEWAQSDEGKAFVTVPGSSGGGSAGPGSGAGSAGKTMSRASFEALDPAGKMEFSKAGGTLTE